MKLDIYENMRNFCKDIQCIIPQAICKKSVGLHGRNTHDGFFDTQEDNYSDVSTF